MTHATFLGQVIPFGVAVPSAHRVIVKVMVSESAYPVSLDPGQCLRISRDASAVHVELETKKRILTKRQREIFEYIHRFIVRWQYAPTLEEIREAFQFGSLATVHEHINTLITKGWVERPEANSPRSLRIAP